MVTIERVQPKRQRLEWVHWSARIYAGLHPSLMPPQCFIILESNGSSWLQIRLLKGVCILAVGVGDHEGNIWNCFFFCFTRAFRILRLSMSFDTLVS